LKIPTLLLAHAYFVVDVGVNVVVETTTDAGHQFELVGELGKLETAVTEFVFEFGDPAREFLGRFSFGLLEVAPLQVVVPEPSGSNGLVCLEDETE
jgi:hypothetical protein